MPQREYTIYQAPTRQGPWSQLKHIHTDMYNAIQVALNLQPCETWLRIVPDGRLEHAQYVAP